MRLKTSKGITLIALIITIIVLLILAGVTIVTLTGENGILNKAETAKEATTRAEAEEQVKLAIMASYGNDGKISGTELKENLNKIEGITGVPTGDITDDSFPLKVTVKGQEVQLNKNGNTITAESTGEVTTPSTPEVPPTEDPGTEEPTTVEVTGVTLNKQELTLAKGAQETLQATITPEDATNKEVTWTSSNEEVATVENGVVKVIGYGTATITVKTTSGEKTASCVVKVNDTRTVLQQAQDAIPTTTATITQTDATKGIVMVDDRYNEWVWIEVPESVFTTATSAEDYDNIKANLITYANDYRGSTDEWYDGCGISSADDYTTMYNKMLSSVYTNKGFYISRYEIGDIESTISNTTRTSSTGVANTPVSMVDQIPYDYVTCSQAQGLASNMKTGEKTSSLLFGIQWDLVCKYLEVNGNWDTTTNTASYYIKTNSTSWGNYNDSTFTINSTNAKKYSSSAWSLITGEKLGEALLTTGASEYTNRMNIYDFAGNVYEWTLEYGTDGFYSPCTCRGGVYYLSSSYYPASVRYSNGTTYSDYGIGFRCSLY